MAESFLWNDKHDILSCIADGRLQTWYYPNAIYVDKELMDLCKNIKVYFSSIVTLNKIIFIGSN